ncbi:MAG: hypothetical protein IKX54_04915 [Lachnospiraceae bacterium]|nr:hypothetical protein [Lachnospiraceae bacterium]
MRAQWSIIQLQVRRKMPKALLAFLFVLVIGCLGYFLLGFRHEDAAEMQPYVSGFAEDGSELDQWELMAQSRSFESGGSPKYIAVIGLIGFFGLVWACLDIPTKKSRSIYTMRRLRVSEKSVVLWDALINTALFLVLLVSVVSLIFLAGKIYASADGYVEGAQGITAAILRNKLYNGLIPIGFPLITLRNIGYAACCGLICASASYMLQNRKMIILHILLLGLCLAAIPFEPLMSYGGDGIFEHIVSTMLSFAWRAAIAVGLFVYTLYQCDRRRQV